MALPIPCVAVRGSTGISVSQGPPSYGVVSAFPKDDSKNCKTMLFSPEGTYFAWANGVNIKIALCSTWKVVAEIDKPKVIGLQFSSKETYLTTIETFIATQDNPRGNPNLHIWRSENGELVKSFIQKNQMDWKPQWSSDDKICGMLINNDVVLYEDTNFEKTMYRINMAKIGKFSIAPGNDLCHILCYMPGKAGQLSFGKLFQYPKFEANQPVANKSFFQTDRVDMYWNQSGTNVLLMTSMDVDKTGASYYGKQNLHHLSIKGETAMVILGKEGPIHEVQWSPKNVEFCVVYGFMPAKATLFNLKSEPVHEFGALHRNSIYYNPQGNILLMGGFGNLRGTIELWDVGNKKLIAKTDAPDTTLLQWSPDGEHFMTATTAPRLRMGNGFKIWHYTGTLLYERPWNKQEALWEVTWQTFPSETFPQKPINYTAVEGITPSQPQASKQAYRPPSARGRTINFKLHDDNEFDSKPTTPATTDANPSKNAIKRKKYREAKKAKKELEASTQNAVDKEDGFTSNKTKNQNLGEVDLTDDPEKNKKIKKIKMKLDQISKLKEQMKTGKQLEINQLNKIQKEDELLKELKELTL